MKKFVGNVNGTSFDNEEEFHKAAEEAIKAGDKKLDISSYSYYTDDEEEKKVDENFVHTNEYFLGNKEPDEIAEDGTVKFYVLDDLVKRINNSINRDSIKKKLEYHLGTLGDLMSRGSYKVDQFKDEIAVHEKKIEQLKSAIEETEKDNKLNCGKYNYYYNLLVAIRNADEPVEEKKEEPVEEKKEDEGEKKSITIDDVINLFGSVALYNTFKKMGMFV